MADGKKTSKTSNNADVFLSEFEELDVANTEELQDNVSTIFSDKEAPSIQDELMFIDDIDFKKDIELPEDDMSKTQEIDLFHDPKFEAAIAALQKSNVGITPKKQPAKVLSKKPLKEPMSMEAAFVNCAILGFITLFSGFGWLFWLLNKIAS